MNIENQRRVILTMDEEELIRLNDELYELCKEPCIDGNPCILDFSDKIGTFINNIPPERINEARKNK